ARERIGRLGGALGHFFFNALGHFAFDVRAFDEAAECGRAAARVLLHFGVARGGVATLFGTLAHAYALLHSRARLAVHVHAVLVHGLAEHVALALFAAFSVA